MLGFQQKLLLSMMPSEAAEEHAGALHRTRSFGYAAHACAAAELHEHKDMPAWQSVNEAMQSPLRLFMLPNKLLGRRRSE